MNTKKEMERHASAERKLQLVHKIRQEQQMNQNAVRGREAFLYGNVSGNHSYISFQEPELGDPAWEDTMISTFRLRAAAALLLFGLFYTFDAQDRPILGIQTSAVYEAVREDYSPILFDFIEEIPYTLQE